MCFAPAFILRSCLISRTNIFKSSALHLKKVDKPSNSDEKSCKHRQIYTNQCSERLITSMFMNRIGRISEIKFHLITKMTWQVHIRVVLSHNNISERSQLPILEIYLSHLVHSTWQPDPASYQCFTITTYALHKLSKINWASALGYVIIRVSN